MTTTAAIIRLNVGGVHYATTKATLTRYPNSMLGAMFNGSMSTTLDDSGSHFIDRDGCMFGHILNFLRSSQLSLPSDFTNLDLLSVEADFYQLEPLIETIRRLRTPDKVSRSSFIEVIEVRVGSTATMPTNNSRDKTIISGRRDAIGGLPSYFFGGEKLKADVSEVDFLELELLGSNVRLRLAEYLQNNGWTLNVSDMSTSSSYDSKSMMPGTIIIEHSYRDRWFKPDNIP